jgi:poly-gamma-glutamate capsule biosynthesis protein CapA/YwtB (metallophosphatase superfamily)
MIISLAGDIMIGRSFNKILNQNPYFNIWGNTAKHTINSDFFGANLETTITNSITKFPNKVFNYKLHPKYSYVLKQNGLDYLNLANNHILDYKKKGLIDTIKVLDNLNIIHTGAGLTKNDAQKIKSITIKNQKINILSAADHYDFWEAPEGIWYYNIDNDENYGNIIEWIKKNRKDDGSLWIFSTHWGSNWEPNVTPNKKRMAYDLVHHGINIIHGTSSHHVQPIEIMENSVIFYGMGDFVDDYAIDVNYRSDLSMIADLNIDKNGKINKIIINPTKIENYQVNFANKNDSNLVINKIF